MKNELFALKKEYSLDENEEDENARYFLQSFEKVIRKKII